ncbi:MAG: glycoside hydrolase family 16 protein [Bacteroidia bacterium]|nr:glycoside hydrolase family 16 protein [Bacteroidia bacterium]
MKNLPIYGLALLALTACKVEPEEMKPVDKGPTEYEGYTLVWNDEFDDASISSLNWTYELGDGSDYGLAAGWGNEEEQIYTNSAENSFIENDGDEVSALVIVAKEESPGSYTSAKLTTQRLQSIRYGRVEARIKLPTDKGMWPAFWMLGDNIDQINWPGCGEIDIVELVGQEPNVIHGSVHYTDSTNRRSTFTTSQTLASGTFEEAYHDFRLDWTPESMIFSLDGVPYQTVPIGEDMKEFQRSFYLILNIAVGGNWPGSPDATTEFPQKMYVDYVRVYRQNGLNPPAAPALDIVEETIGVFIPPSKAQHPFNSKLGQFPEIALKSYGAGGEPTISSTAVAAEGDSALIFSYPGGGWGGGWFEMSTPMDMTAYAGGNIVFSLLQPADMATAELKLEAVGNSAAVFLIDYTPVALGNEYVQYTIPIADFVGLDLTRIRIPFALWNPKNAAGDYSVMDVHIDDIYWE